MQTRLEVSRSTHAKMLVHPPRLNLRRAKSYNGQGPLSATSSRFNFNHLLFSPPPSPSLPALIPRPKKSPIRPRPTRVFRLVIWIAGTVFIFYVAALAVRRREDIRNAALPYLTRKNEAFEMVGQDRLPDFPTPVVVMDGWGKSKWTVSIPPDHEFPLSVTDYANMAGKCREVAGRARDLHHTRPDQQTIQSMMEPDPYFLDVEEAEKAQLLPGPNAERGQKSGRGYLVGENKDSFMPQCEKSMTFVLESEDAGLGNTLMTLWTFYGLAKEHGRAFFIDDTRWAYGRYTDLFQPPPVPDCRPPPRHEMIPCPVQARHLVVSSATAQDALVGTLSTQKIDAAAGDDEGQKMLFDLARRGSEALFHPNQEDAGYIDKRVNELTSKVSSSPTSKSHTDSLVIGMHIRRGDNHPLEFQYRDSYIPLNIFTEQAHRAIQEWNNTSSSNSDPLNTHVVIASDDPTVHDALEFSEIPHSHAQERIKLASKGHVKKKAKSDKKYMHRFVDETFGWEGGFYSAMFWNLGQPIGKDRDVDGSAPPSAQKEGDKTKKNTKKKEKRTSDQLPSEEVVKLRSYLGRAYVMDLAVLARASDVVVCGVGSMGCRILGVVLGWEAVSGGRWVNVDGEYGWMGLAW